ncbi:MAG: NAD-dependent epimerase/dehydratase family protein [Candidatus Aenigmatarchaeota archaeon]
MSNMQALVTGGAGFIGHKVVEKLLEKNYFVRVVDNLSKGEAKNLEKHFSNPNFEFVKTDLLNLEAAKQVMEGCDICFHLAAKIGGIGYFHKYPATILRDNNVLTLNIFEAARDSNTKIVYVSSSMVFERTNQFPTPETAVDTSPPPLTAYGFSKLVGEYIARAYNAEFGIQFVIGRPFNAYGPGEIPGDFVGYAHVIPDLVKKILSGQYPLQILGSGEQIRCYTYVDDIAEGLVLIGEKAKNDDFNIADPRPTSVKELTDILWKICGRKEELKFEHVEPFEFDVQKRIPDISKIQKKFGWKPKVSLEEGLKITVEWLRKKL